MIPAKHVKGSIEEGEVSKKVKVTQHEGGQSVSQKSQVTRNSRSSLVLKDLLVGTELILFCGPRYFGIWRERTWSCVDGEDGIGE